MKENNININKLDKCGRSVLLCTCIKFFTGGEREGDLSEVKNLLEQKADPNFGKLPLYYACQMKSPPLVELLLKFGADPNLMQDNFTPLEVINTKPRLEIMEYPEGMALGSRITRRQPISNLYEITKLLINYGAEVTQKLIEFYENLEKKGGFAFQDKEIFELLKENFKPKISICFSK